MGNRRIPPRLVFILGNNRRSPLAIKGWWVDAGKLWSINMPEL